jgi:gliding motility-associated-like protein
MKYLSTLLIFLAVSFSPLAQRGKDGSYTVTAANTLVNSYTVLNANATAGQSIITVASNAMVGGFFTGVLTPGDLILIVQMQGASLNVDTYPASEYVTSGGAFWGPYTTPIGHLNDWNQFIALWGEVTNYNNSGKFELAEVKSLAGNNSISLMCPLVNSYTSAGRVQIVRVPRFVNLTVNANATIVPTSWNGSTGGIVALEVNQNLVINANGKISASGFGFRGGVTEDQTLGSPPGNVNDIGFCASHIATQGAEKGEGIAGFYTEYDAIYSRYCKSAPANGGGGGNNHNSGGGGGSNVGNTALTYTGKGIPDPVYNVNWNLEAAGMGGSVSPGGGRGGYSGATINQNENTVGPNNTTWGGDYRRKEGGLGGHPLQQDNSRIFMGGGGGAGDQNNGQGGGGGRGGGIAYIKVYGTLSGSGTIEANGANGINANPNGQTALNASTQKFGNDGAGGAGGGGSLYLSNGSAITNTISLQANGGIGGNQVISFGAFASSPTMEADGPGGGGGGGYISISSGTPSIQVSGGIAGVTNSSFVPNFPQNGATGGAPGISNTNTSFYDILASNDTICGNGSAQLTASTVGNPPAGNLTWYTTPFGNTVAGTGNTFTSPVLNTTTTYYVGICPGSFRKPVTVVIGASPSLSGNAVVTNATCLTPGSITGLSANGGALPYTYAWSNNAGNSLNLTNAPAGTYTLTVYDAAGCSTTSSPYTITGTNGPTINTANVVISPQNCSGSLGSFSGITATGTGLSYAWSNNGGTVLNPNNLTSGVYTLTVTDANGCIATSGPLTIPFVSGPSLDTSQIAYLTEHCGQQDGGIVGITASGNGLQYQWTPGNSNSIDLINAAAGQYSLVVTDANNCSDTVGPITIPASLPPSIDVNFIQVMDELCGQNNGGITGIMVTGGTAPLSCLWSNQQTTLNLPVGLSPGSYSLVVTDSEGCTDSISGITIGSVGGPTIDTSQMVITPVGCLGEPGSISGITSNAGGATFAWSNGVTTINNPSVAAGSYVLSITDANNCLSTLTVVVDSLTPVTLNENQVVLTHPTCVTSGSINGIIPEGGTGNYSYTWEPGNIGGGVQFLTGVGAGNYTLVVTDANGCSDTSATYTLNPPVYPVASFTYSPAIINLGDTVTFTNNSLNYTTEQWVNAGITIFQPSPWTYSYTTGTFQVTLTVTNDDGCVDTANAFITVYDEMITPNVITPNGDNVNDVLYIQSLKPNTAISILNRWGVVVYSSVNYLNDWNGKDDKGDDLTDGVYTVMLTEIGNLQSYFFIHLIR